MDSVNIQINVIDLISETHTRLRRRVLLRWEESGNESISQSETHLLAKINMNPLTISEAARQTGVSRQATQKTASKLIDKGYVTFRHQDDNRRDKYMFLTSRGKNYIELSEKMKRKMEEDMMKKIGSDRINELKEILNSL